MKALSGGKLLAETRWSPDFRYTEQPEEQTNPMYSSIEKLQRALQRILLYTILRIFSFCIALYILRRRTSYEFDFL